MSNSTVEHNKISTRTTERVRRRVSKSLAIVSAQVVTKPLDFLQLTALDHHVYLMLRILNEGDK